MSKKSDQNNDPRTQLFVYGLDEAGKPKGARFSMSEMETVFPVVTAQKLQFFDGGVLRRSGQARHEASRRSNPRPRKILHSEYQARPLRRDPD
jgi:hypothetical protein